MTYFDTKVAACAMKITNCKKCEKQKLCACRVGREGLWKILAGRVHFAQILAGEGTPRCERLPKVLYLCGLKQSSQRHSIRGWVVRLQMFCSKIILLSSKYRFHVYPRSKKQKAHQS